MSDRIVTEKKEISATQYLYGCEVDELSIDVEYEIQKHIKQIEKAKILSEKLYDQQSRIRARIVKVNNAQNWNQLMLDNLKKGK